MVIKGFLFLHCTLHTSKTLVFFFFFNNKDILILQLKCFLNDLEREEMKLRVSPDRIVQVLRDLGRECRLTLDTSLPTSPLSSTEPQFYISQTPLQLDVVM